MLGINIVHCRYTIIIIIYWYKIIAGWLYTVHYARIQCAWVLGVRIIYDGIYFRRV